MIKNFIREKKIYCGDNYLEVDIFPLSENQSGRKKNKRSKKEKVSLSAQKKLNDKNARRKFIWIAEANFGRSDLHVTLTYSDEYLPKTVEQAEKEVRNYLRRISRARKKKGVEDLKYMLVTSSRTELREDGEKPVRIHHHIIMNAGLKRDEVERLWRTRKKKGEKEGASIGYANADRIQPDKNSGIVALANYLSGNPTQKRRWTCSQNLKRPVVRNNDCKYSRKKTIQLAMHNEDLSIFEKIYPGWYVADKDNGFITKYNDLTGWSIYLKLRRKQKETSYQQQKNESKKIRYII